MFVSSCYMADAAVAACFLQLFDDDQSLLLHEVRVCCLGVYYLVISCIQHNTCCMQQNLVC